MSTINNIDIHCIKGDITKQNDIEAIVNAANSNLAPGGGVAGAIHRASGPELYEECKTKAPIKTGEAIITKGYQLINKYVIHCLGPVYGIDKPEKELLQACYANALDIAEAHRIKSIAFPAISTGIFGYPVDIAAEHAFEIIIHKLNDLQYVESIRFVLFSQKDYNIHQDKLDILIKNK